jgi:hypothetical protein
MQKPIEGMTQTPYGDDEMIPAWIGLLRYALSKEECREEFKMETDIDIADVINSRGLNSLIDQATGYQKNAIIKFADWVTKKLWGVEE